ncbi:Glucooligosaccharide oxidase [Meredithblackwellia eburnea MCA 4105]
MRFTCAVGVALLTLVCSTPAAATSHHFFDARATTKSSLIDCLSESALTYYPTSSQFGNARASFNRRIQPTPFAITYPDDVQAVSDAVECAIGRGIPVAVRSGGHSYGSHGLGGVSGALVIDLEKFNIIRVTAKGTAKIGAGTRLGDVVLKLAARGRALPHGDCPFIGMGGHAGYAGFGFASRWQGLTVDNVIALDVVLANGTILMGLTQNTDEDLFWALRGAAPSFGIITSFYVKTFPRPTEVINFTYSWEGLSVAAYSSILKKLQSFGLKHAPAELGISMVVGPEGYGEASVSGVYHGSKAQFKSVMGGFVKSLPSGAQKSVKQLSWVESQQLLAGDQKLDTKAEKDYRDTFYAKSLMTPSDHLMSDAAIKSFFTYLKKAKTDTHWFIEIDLYGGEGSAINNVPLTENSFGHRDKLFTIQFYASSENYQTPYPKGGLEFIEGAYNSIQIPMASKWNKNTPSGAYVNYVDPKLTRSEVRSLYWSSQYTRLSKLRSVYDPHQLFRNPQSIVPS